MSKNGTRKADGGTNPLAELREHLERGLSEMDGVGGATEFRAAMDLVDDGLLGEHWHVAETPPGSRTWTAWDWETLSALTGYTMSSLRGSLSKNGGRVLLPNGLRVESATARGAGPLLTLGRSSGSTFSVIDGGREATHVGWRSLADATGWSVASLRMRMSGNRAGVVLPDGRVVLRAGRDVAEVVLSGPTFEVVDLRRGGRSTVYGWGPLREHLRDAVGVTWSVSKARRASDDGGGEFQVDSVRASVRVLRLDARGRGDDV